MKVRLCVTAAAILTSASLVRAEPAAHDSGAVKTYAENRGGVKEGDWETVSANAAVTRRPCPHTCEERQLPKEHCKTWKSKDGALCYVWDTRLPQDAIPVGK